MDLGSWELTRIKKKARANSGFCKQARAFRRGVYLSGKPAGGAPVSGIVALSVLLCS
jgi:hypothetical protein